VFYGTCIAFALIVLVPIARYVGFSVLKFCRYMLDEILLLLSIANSEALLPRLMKKLERLGVSKSVVGLVVPTVWVAKDVPVTFGGRVCAGTSAGAVIASELGVAATSRPELSRARARMRAMNPVVAR